MRFYYDSKQSKLHFIKLPPEIKRQFVNIFVPQAARQRQARESRGTAPEGKGGLR